MRAVLQHPLGDPGVIGPQAHRQTVYPLAYRVAELDDLPGHEALLTYLLTCVKECENDISPLFKSLQRMVRPPIKGEYKIRPYEKYLRLMANRYDTKFCFQCNKLKVQFADNPGFFNLIPITENRKRFKRLWR